jgi:DNA-binding CsgD family transcriptional regulator
MKSAANPTRGSMRRRGVRNPVNQVPPLPPGAVPSGGLKRGSAIVYLKTFVMDRFGESAWDAMLASFTDCERELLVSVEAAGWYDLALHARLNRELCNRFCGGSLSIALELGRFTAEQEFMVYSWIARLVKPSIILRNMNMYWRRGNETGRLTTATHGDELLVRLFDWGIAEPALCQRFLGYLGRMLEYFGPVTSTDHHHCRALGAPTCDFRFRWQLRHVGADHARPLSTTEFVNAAFELQKCEDIDDLSDGIVNLLLSFFPCYHVKLWLRRSEGGDPMMFREAGEPRRPGLTRYFVLRAGERAVGRLEVTSVSKWPDELAGSLENVLPAMATAIAHFSFSATDRPGSAFENSPNHPTDFNFREEVERRLDKARDLWGLTDRETEALGLLARGRSNKEIVFEFRTKEGTVDAKLASIRGKAGVDSTRLLLVKFWSEL